MADVARLAGVSTMTVSNCLKFPDKVSPETRQRVRTAISELGYIPNLVAGTLSSGRSRIVAAITPTIRNSNFAGIITGLNRALAEEGYHLIVSVIDDPADEHEAVTALIARRVDGIVLTDVDRDRKTSSLLRKSDIPVVETWDVNGPFIDLGVGFSERQATRDGTQIMIDKGLQTIGMVSYAVSGKKRYQERLSGFLDAVRGAGLRDDLIAIAPDKSDFAGGKIALTELLEKEPSLQGVFCSTDILAAGAYFECLERGWPVPEKLSIVGYGDYEIASALPGGLTTIHQPGNEIGREAASMIIARNRGEKLPKNVIDVGYDVLVRGST